ncbi:MAG TPA: hypothetical protein VF295_04055 [Candidatus Limnocylindria bacterium]|jgi:hypothetical protein
MPTTAAGPRDARVGDLLPLDRVRARRIDATALLLPGTAETTAYTDALAARADDFAAWDGRVAERLPDGRETHRLLILDRYGQVYAIHDAATTEELPDADALEEWFRFLATACPECGVIDDPSRYGPTP